MIGSNCKEQPRTLPRRYFSLSCLFYRWVSWDSEKERNLSWYLYYDSESIPCVSQDEASSLHPSHDLAPFSCQCVSYREITPLSYHWGNWGSEKTSVLHTTTLPKTVGGAVRTGTPCSACLDQFFLHTGCPAPSAISHGAPWVPTEMAWSGSETLHWEAPFCLTRCFFFRGWLVNGSFGLIFRHHKVVII